MYVVTLDKPALNQAAAGEYLATDPRVLQPPSDSTNQKQVLLQLKSPPRVPGPSRSPLAEIRRPAATHADNRAK